MFEEWLCFIGCTWARGKSMKFELNEKEITNYEKFKAKCDKQIAREQKIKLSSDPEYDDLCKQTKNWKEPYLGTYKGGYTIGFSPNSVCRTVKVTCDLLNITEDITDYDCF